MDHKSWIANRGFQSAAFLSASQSIKRSQFCGILMVFVAQGNNPSLLIIKLQINLLPLYYTLGPTKGLSSNLQYVYSNLSGF